MIGKKRKKKRNLGQNKLNEKEAKTEFLYAKISKFGKVKLSNSLETRLCDCWSAIMPHVCYGSGNVNFSLCTLLPTEA